MTERDESIITAVLPSLEAEAERDAKDEAFANIKLWVILGLGGLIILALIAAANPQLF